MSLKPTDPFAEELQRHGIHARPFDNANREKVRVLADPERTTDACAECAALVEQFDAAFSHHLLFG